MENRLTLHGESGYTPRCVKPRPAAFAYLLCFLGLFPLPYPPRTSALSGFHYSAVDQHISFTDKPGHYFWSTGYAWEVSSLCRVVIIKTPLTLPYTSTFFNLDCGYWDTDREAKIRQ